METTTRAHRAGLVALAASLWGTSALLREPLLGMGLPASTMVLAEHVVLTLCLAPWMAPAVRRLLAASWRTKASVVVIGAGSSAIATTAFTAAFALGDPVTPQVLQKLQPVFAILLAALLLAERVRPRFWWFAVPALAGAWLLAFPDPTSVAVRTAAAAGLATVAAALWALGTVLGRGVSGELRPVDVTALRFGIGMLTMLAVVGLQGNWVVPSAEAVPLLLGLALVPGLLALLLYYRGLAGTRASLATLAELAFPVTAALVGVVVLDGSLTTSQWVGFAVVLTAVTALVLQDRPGPAAPVVVEPERARLSMARGS